ncbi:hypothetical protein [Subtercola lobariae]|uniref:Uncharacterized protein n=1 Tax=Subtercola lobariae TaxID=1588641 RepID=A0A917B5Z5_9MICO|nr:hypothetical protein [Subtercola lobariae]GGF22380.1 hypothetical protein GCM10011399_15050 [Subtercola lobariae]
MTDLPPRDAVANTGANPGDASHETATETEAEAGSRDAAPAIVANTGEAAQPPAQPNGDRGALIVVVAASVVALLMVLGGSFWAWSALSQSRYNAASIALQTQLGAEAVAVHAYDARLADMNSLALRIASVTARPEFTADTSAEAGALRQDLGVAQPLATAPAATSPDSADALPAAGYRPAWQLLGDSEHLEALTRQSQQTTAQLSSKTTDAKSAEDTLTAAEAAYFSATATTAEQLIATDTLSNRSVQVPLIHLIDQARNPSMSLSRDGAFLGSIVDAEAQVRASQATNQAHQNDPAWSVRREIEAYARSLSNGIALEFVWAPEVSGLGSGWLSGTAQTFDTDGGYAIISLNYSVEDAWTDGLNETDDHALVAHEVGHTQIYRCAKLFNDPAFAGNQETWATAWSISQGFDVEGSGIQAYGRPTDAQIALAAQCR